MGTISRRELLRQGPRALGGLLFPGLLGLKEYRWFELVQDRNEAAKWHVNLFAGPEIGDIARASHLSYQVAEIEDIVAFRRQLPHPARLQFRDGHEEVTFDRSRKGSEEW